MPARNELRVAQQAASANHMPLEPRTKHRGLRDAPHEFAAAMEFGNEQQQAGSLFAKRTFAQSEARRYEKSPTR
ncbi:MAG: hypothetical protein JF606_06020 [Burkholderiales bacterium]|nr:hypothetical protein [Burkholderiales bacterium]